jgi:hypothetical protein
MEKRVRLMQVLIVLSALLGVLAVQSASSRHSMLTSSSRARD